MSYSATQGFGGKGFTLTVNTGTVSTPVWTPVYEGFSAKPAMKNGMDDATNFQSSGEEYVPTMPDGGEWSFSFNRVASDPGQLALQTAFFAQTLLMFEATAPKGKGQMTAGDMWAFSAYVSDLNPDFDPKKKITNAGKLRTSNGVTFTAGS